MPRPRWLAVLTLACLLLVGAAGCGVLDAAAAPGQDGGPSLIQRAATAAANWSPEAAAVLAIFGTVYYRLRSARKDAALESVVAGVESARSTATGGQLALAALLGALRGVQEAAGTRSEVRAVVKRVRKAGPVPT